MTLTDLLALGGLVNTVAAFAALFTSMWFAWRGKAGMALYLAAVAIFFRVGALAFSRGF